MWNNYDARFVHHYNDKLYCIELLCKTSDMHLNLLSNISMTANLGYLAPMPIADICTAISPNTLHYAYNDWPKEYDNVTNPTKILRGTKCPRGGMSFYFNSKLSVSEICKLSLKKGS